MTKPNASFLPPPVPCLSQEFVGENTQSRLSLHPHPLRAYCWLASLPPFTQPSQHLPMVVHRVFCASWSPACGMAALIGVLDRCSVSANISRVFILLPSCSHFCLSFTARPLPTFSASLVRALTASKGACVKKTATTINQRGRKVCLPFVFLLLMPFGLLIHWCYCPPSPRAGRWPRWPGTFKEPNS